MKKLLGAIVFLLADPVWAEPVTITLEPVALHKTDETITRVGKLTHVAGYQLKADPAAFGGWSGMALRDDGKAFIAVSDGGTILRVRVDEHEPGKIIALGDGFIEPLYNDKGKRLKGKRTEDAEGIIDLSGGGLWGPFLVSFERDDRILKYEKYGSAGHLVFTPPASVTIPNNDGMEAIVQLEDNLFLLSTEKAKDGNGNIIGWLWDGINPPRQLALKQNGRHWPTEYARLPNGDVLVLERDWNPLQGLSISFRRIARNTIKPGAVLDGEHLATMNGNHFHMDNMEGLGVRVTKDGRTLVYVLSDDNFNRRGQRTLLQIFELAD